MSFFLTKQSLYSLTQMCPLSSNQYENANTTRSMDTSLQHHLIHYSVRQDKNNGLPLYFCLTERILLFVQLSYQVCIWGVRVKRMSRIWWIDPIKPTYLHILPPPAILQKLKVDPKSFYYSFSLFTWSEKLWEISLKFILLKLFLFNIWSFFEFVSAHFLKHHLSLIYGTAVDAITM